jgi:hypothetical protein
LRGYHIIGGEYRKSRVDERKYLLNKYRILDAWKITEYGGVYEF